MSIVMPFRALTITSPASYVFFTFSQRMIGIALTPDFRRAG
jgi:hypothetical protein